MIPGDQSNPRPGPNTLQSPGPVTPPLGAYFRLPHWPRQVDECEVAQDTGLSLQSDPGPPMQRKATRVMPRWIGLTIRLNSDASQPSLDLAVSAQAPEAFLVPVYPLVRP